MVIEVMGFGWLWLAGVVIVFEVVVCSVQKQEKVLRLRDTYTFRALLLQRHLW